MLVLSSDGQSVSITAGASSAEDPCYYATHAFVRNVYLLLVLVGKIRDASKSTRV